MRYLTIMKGSICHSLLVGLLLLLSFHLAAQSKEELQRERDKLNEQIAFTKKLISEAKKDQETTFGRLSMLDEQIRFRSQLQKSYEREVEGIEASIVESDKVIREQEARVEAMKKEYAAMIAQSYKSRRSHNELMYLFAAEDFNQAFKRFKIMQEYADYRKRQAAEIRRSQQQLRDRIVALEREREEKELLIEEKAREAETLLEDKSERERILAELKLQEKKLIKQQEQQELERQRLNAAIRRIIEEELAAEKEKNDGKFELTPEGKIVSVKFEQNKSNLPWPVLRGVITSRFGKHAHETIPGITIENNGVDISTEEGANVLAVFGGTVTSVFTIPGAGKNVIVTHGAYKTVYSHLEAVTVKKGDTVDAGAALGNVLTISGKHICHLEIWKMTKEGGTPQNPELWISKP